MTRFPTDHPVPRGHRPSSPTGGVCGALIRVAVTDGSWAERLPPAPPGATVTVSLSSTAALSAHGAALRFLGYRVVEPSGIETAVGQVADFLVPADVAAGHPTWWRALAAVSDRTFSLAFGPVLVQLADALRPHTSFRRGN